MDIHFDKHSLGDIYHAYNVAIYQQKKVEYV